MTGIPDDVMTEAAKFRMCNGTGGCIRHDDRCGEELVCLSQATVARAIVAERQRWKHLLNRAKAIAKAKTLTLPT